MRVELWAQQSFFFFYAALISSMFQMRFCLNVKPVSHSQPGWTADGSLHPFRRQ